jgi:hypothetical protein
MILSMVDFSACGSETTMEITDRIIITDSAQAGLRLMQVRDDPYLINIFTKWNMESSEVVFELRASPVKIQIILLI